MVSASLACIRFLRPEIYSRRPSCFRDVFGIRWNPPRVVTMTFICLWSPAAAREKELLQQLIPSLLGAAPRVLLGTNGIVWADARGMSAEPLATDLLAVFHEKGVEKVRAALSISPICAEVAARHGKGGQVVIIPGTERDYLA